MGRRAVTPEQLARLLETFRTDPEPGSPASFGRAALAAGVDRRTARKAWAAGWPGTRAISETIEVERTLARAALRREVLAQRLDEAARLAQEDAVEERSRAGHSVRMIATAARNALAALHAERVHDYQRILARLMQDVEDPGSPKACAARKAYRDIVEIVARAAEAAERGQIMEARILGEPTTIVGGEIGVRPLVPAKATSAEIAAEAEAALRAAEEIRELEAAEEKEAAPHAGGGIVN